MNQTALSAAVSRPVHIPEAAVYGFDMFQDPAYRAPLQHAFSPTAMLALKDDIRALATDLIDGVADRGRRAVWDV